MSEVKEKKKVGSPLWYPGMESPNKKGRNPGIPTLEKTNRQRRNDAFMDLVRKFKPLQTLAIQAAVKILNDEEANDANKLKSSALIIGTYRDLIKDLYDKNYDDENAEAMNETDNMPRFSLRMINTEEDKAA
jgi:hypothetical protein